MGDGSFSRNGIFVASHYSHADCLIARAGRQIAENVEKRTKNSASGNEKDRRFPQRPYQVRFAVLQPYQPSPAHFAMMGA